MIDTINFDTFAIRARMMYPLDEAAGHSAWAAMQRDWFVRQALQADHWPISMEKDQFLFFAEAPLLTAMEKELAERRRLGWIIAMAFHYYFASGTSTSEVIAVQEGGSERKFLSIASKVYGDLNIPGTEIEMSITRPGLEKAKKEVWPVAHYWAALFNPSGQLWFAEPEAADDWWAFMTLAETYRLMGQAHRIFEKLAPKGVDAGDVCFDSRFGPFEGMDTTHLSAEAIKYLESYRSLKFFYSQLKSKNS